MRIVIHTSHWPLLIWIVLTWHFITLTNKVYRIGLIRISIMNKIRMTITTLHWVSGDTTLLSHNINNLTNISCVYSISRSTDSKEIFFRKEFRRLSWVHTKIPNIDTQSQKIPMSKILTPFFKSHHTKKNYRVRKEDRIQDSISKRSFRYDRSKT